MDLHRFRFGFAADDQSDREGKASVRPGLRLELDLAGSDVTRLSLDLVVCPRVHETAVCAFVLFASMYICMCVHLMTYVLGFTNVASPTRDISIQHFVTKTQRNFYPCRIFSFELDLRVGD